MPMPMDALRGRPVLLGPVENVSWQGTVRYTAKVLALALAYFGAATKAGLLLAYENSSVTAVWAPTGISLAALVLWGRGLWPGVALGALLANCWTGVPVITVLGIATGNTLEALVGASLLRLVGLQAVARTCARRAGARGPGRRAQHDGQRDRGRGQPVRRRLDLGQRVGLRLAHLVGGGPGRRPAHRAAHSGVRERSPGPPTPGAASSRARHCWPRSSASATWCSPVIPRGHLCSFP